METVQGMGHTVRTLNFGGNLRPLRDGERLSLGFELMEEQETDLEPLHPSANFVSHYTVQGKKIVVGFAEGA